MFKKKCYPFDLAVKVEIEDKSDVKAHYKHHASTTSLAQLAKSVEAGNMSADVGLPELKYGTIQDDLPEGWELIPYDKVGTFYAGNVSDLSRRYNPHDPNCYRWHTCHPMLLSLLLH
jgi:sphingosine kinase